MKLYYDRKTTPLKFHKFFWFVMIPVLFLFDLQELISVLSKGDVFSYPRNIIFFRDIAIVLLELTCFIGFFRWSKYAWFSIIPFFCVEYCYNIYFLFFGMIYYPQEDNGYFIENLIIISLFAIPIILYYLKRRPLFFINRNCP